MFLTGRNLFIYLFIYCRKIANRLHANYRRSQKAKTCIVIQIQRVLCVMWMGLGGGGMPHLTCLLLNTNLNLLPALSGRIRSVSLMYVRRNNAARRRRAKEKPRHNDENGILLTRNAIFILAIYLKFNIS